MIEDMSKLVAKMELLRKYSLSVGIEFHIRKPKSLVMIKLDKEKSRWLMTVADKTFQTNSYHDRSSEVLAEIMDKGYFNPKFKSDICVAAEQMLTFYAIALDDSIGMLGEGELQSIIDSQFDSKSNVIPFNRKR